MDVYLTDELLSAIANLLADLRDLSAFARCNTHLYRLLITAPAAVGWPRLLAKMTEDRPRAAADLADMKSELMRDYCIFKRTREVYYHHLLRGQKTLAEVPRVYRGPDMCWRAVYRNARALSDVPFKRRTPDMCLMAVSRCGDMLPFVPKKFRSRTICQTALASRPSHRAILLAVARHGLLLSDVAPDLLTKKICMAAVTNNGFALHFVPSRLMSAALCRAARMQRMK